MSFVKYQIVYDDGLIGGKRGMAIPIRILLDNNISTTICTEYEILNIRALML